MARRRGDELPKQRRRLNYDYSFLADEKVWLLVRGEDFPEGLRIESVQKRVRNWAARHGYTRAAGYVVETRVEKLDPDTREPYAPGKARRSINAADASLEYGLSVHVHRDAPRVDAG